jgi:vancomycin permeability regulator SanA
MNREITKNFWKLRKTPRERLAIGGIFNNPAKHCGMTLGTNLFLQHMQRLDNWDSRIDEKGKALYEKGKITQGKALEEE